jgi:protein TonB
MNWLKKRSIVPALIISLLLHFALFRFIRIDPETEHRDMEKFEVKLLYHTPPPKAIEKPASKPKKKIIKKKETIKKPLEKQPEELQEKEVEEIKEETAQDTLEEQEQAEDNEAESSTTGEEGEEISEDRGQTAAIDIGPIVAGLRKRIMEKKIYPSVAKKKGIEGVVLLFLLLDEEGNLAELEVKQSSGHRILDKAAVALIKKVVPYEHDTGQKIPVEIPIHYSIVN